MLELNGMSVVVTRAAHQAEELCTMIEAAGGRAIRLPVSKIEAVDDRDDLLIEGLKQLGGASIAIFISQNAVDFGLALLSRRQQGFPPECKIVAVGPATARLLQEKGLEVTAYPSHQFDSDALLALPLLQDIEGRGVMIFKGVGGLNEIARSLSKRGAFVTALPCYRRLPVERLEAAIIDEWSRSYFDALVLTSASAVDHLGLLLGDKFLELTEPMKVVVPSERVAAHCRERGFTGALVVAENAGMSALVKALAGPAIH